MKTQRKTGVAGAAQVTGVTGAEETTRTAKALKAIPAIELGRETPATQAAPTTTGTPKRPWAFAQRKGWARRRDASHTASLLAGTRPVSECLFHGEIRSCFKAGL